MSYKYQYRPSNLNRRELCPASARLELGLESTSQYAECGTLLHKRIAEGILTPAHRATILAGLPDIDAAECVNACWRVAEDEFKKIRAASVDTTSFVCGVEKQIDLAPLGIDHDGTIDFYLTAKDEETMAMRLCVIDWKTGFRYIPHPRNNLQLQTYVFALMQKNFHKYIETAVIEYGYFQPMVHDSPVKIMCDFSDLSNLKSRVAKIIKNCEDDNSPAIPGAWCDNCSACESCKARFAIAARAETIADFINDKMQSLTPAARRQAYESLKAGSKKIKEVVEKIESCIISGEIVVDGYCAGSGRITRKWKNDFIAEAFLSRLAIEAGIDVNSVSTPISPAQAKKLFPDKNLSEFIEEKEGNPTVKRSPV